MIEICQFVAILECHSTPGYRVHQVKTINEPDTTFAKAPFIAQLETDGIEIGTQVVHDLVLSVRVCCRSEVIPHILLIVDETSVETESSPYCRFG